MPRKQARAALLLLAVAAAAASAQLSLRAAAAAKAPAAAHKPLGDLEIDKPHAAAWEHVWSVALLQRVEMIQAKRAEALASRTGDAADGGEEGIAPLPPPLRLLIVGDSTMQHQANFLCQVLKAKCNMLTRKGCKNVPDNCTNKRLNVRVELQLTWACAWDWQKTAPPAAQNEATVFYYNCGLHMMHLFPARPFMEVSLSLDAHSMVRDSFVHAREQLGEGALLVWMTTNDIAEDRFTKEYNITASEWKTKEAADGLTSKCVDHYGPEVQAMRGVGATEGGWVEELEDWCRNGVLTGSGAQWLNSRLLKHIPNGVQILDGYTTTRGRPWATRYSDGRHYRLLRPIKLEQLFSHISRHFL
uniref:Uncharacterized protein n=1 Tax=Chlamydomonas euryale TaxID=1486919 RepID=A0A7R9YSB3_9CHLO|mmetsp:Transcript_18116/g.54155  ORF Transcript_18116/g.54155 Transcript_18116/m.54155 type:complete len:359 (+) Transcript_18116:183-1259(+)